jgi:hypothetical protein
MRGQALTAQPTIAGLVLADVFAHPGSSISEITARTGMPQSHVSETVARLREQGTVESFPDPADRRRTRQRAAPEERHARRTGPGRRRAGRRARRSRVRKRPGGGAPGNGQHAG